MYQFREQRHSAPGTALVTNDATPKPPKPRWPPGLHEPGRWHDWPQLELMWIGGFEAGELGTMLKATDALD